MWILCGIGLAIERNAAKLKVNLAGRRKDMLLDIDHNEIAMKLIEAIGSGNLELLKQYFENGWEDIYNQYKHDFGPLVWVAVNNNEYDILQFLVDRGYSVDYFDIGSLLHLAIGTGYVFYTDRAVGLHWDKLEKNLEDHLKIVKLLLAQGLKVSQKDHRNRNVLDCAYAQGYYDETLFDLLESHFNRELAEQSQKSE